MKSTCIWGLQMQLLCTSSSRRRTRRSKFMHLRWEEPCSLEVQEPGAAFIRHSWFRLVSLLWSMLIMYSCASMQVDRNMSSWNDLCQPNVGFVRAPRVVFVPTDPAGMFWTA